jgi:hypothetical protein
VNDAAPAAVLSVMAARTAYLPSADELRDEGARRAFCALF